MIYGGEQINMSVIKARKDYKNLQAAERRKLIYKFLDYYTGENTNRYIKDKFSIKAFNEVPLSSFNITKRFIDRMARVYTLGASRTLSSNQTEYDALTFNKDYTFKHLEKMTKLLGTIAVQISLNTDDKKNPYFEYNPIYNFDVHMDADNPFKPVAIKYPILLPTDDTADESKILYAYWDDNYYKVLDEEGVTVSEKENPYGTLPFVFFHKDHLIDGFYCYPAYDIINCNEMINIMFTEMNLGMRFQMFGQYVITGLYGDEKIKRVGSDEMIILPEGANLSIEAPSINIDQALKLARNMIELVAQNNHLNVSFADTNKDRPSSGVALKILDVERNDDFLDDLDIWRSIENKVYRMEKLIAGFEGYKLPNNIGLDFNEPEYPQSVPDQIAMDTWMLENNLTTKAQLLQRSNKDLTIKQAEKIVKENEKANGGTEEPTQRIFNRLRQGVTGA